MGFPTYMLLPLAAALAYSYGSLYFKQAFQHGIGLVHSFVVTNWAMALVFAPIIFLAELPSFGWIYLQPLVCALGFCLGNVLTISAIRRGDMSVVVPVMGTKAFFVAVGASLFFGKTIAPAMWIACVLAAIGIYVLGRSDRTEGKGQSGAIGLTILSSACFGICDAAIQAWAPDFGSKGFMGSMFVVIAVFSTGFLKIARRPITGADRTGMKALIIGSGIIALQGILVAISVVSFDNATGVNVIYSARGLFSIALVWWIGHRFSPDTHESERQLLAQRLVGAAIMMAAVAFAVLASPKG